MTHSAENDAGAGLLFGVPVQSRETDERYTPAHAQKRSSMPLSMHGFGPRAVAALQRFARRQSNAGVLMVRTEMAEHG